MMNDRAPADREARAAAIDAGRSFIVQAPAGSGKTSLLTQRFLRLLAEVERPEEIVAITFTRKAAAEMRHRIVAALTAATAGMAPGTGEHELQTLELARAALANSARRGWELARHPSRLHIQTIDGLNHWLAARLPLSARLGPSPGLLDDARPLYQEAAARFVARLEQDDDLAVDIAGLVRLLGHDPARLEALLADMLSRREIWLPKLLELGAAGDMHAGMEALLAAACRVGLERARASLDDDLMRDVMGVLGRAGARDGGPLQVLAGLAELPPPTVAARPQWDCLVATLLTGTNSVRKRLDRRLGFPPGNSDDKSTMLTLLDRLAGRPAQVEALAGLRQLPPARYTPTQWLRIEALCKSLVPAAAELQALFAERSVADHAAVAAAARQALGPGHAPSELAQALEYRIRHVLVDEYQDTSPSQQRLLERLVAGWQPGDGHTLFCVGDPMQSIYGFREADVTLFLEAQSQGIGDVRLATLSLSRNFRSAPAIVDWVNATFGQLLPANADYESGAVPHTRSSPTRRDEPDAGVVVHALAGRDETATATAVADAVEQALAAIAGLERADEDAAVRAVAPRNVAVLVRARPSLPPILAELRRRGIEYRGVELESLADRAAVRDLLALARALLHPGDRTAWLAILRAPWCGLTLADLHALAAADRQATILSRMQAAGGYADLSVDGRERIARVLPILLASLADQGRTALGSWVRACWVALGGPATLEDASDLDNAAHCFAALDALCAEAGPVPAASAVEEAVEGLMASPVGSADARVQLMTIHKAKGLEFDTVIVPGLERTVPADRRQLLYWTQVAIEGSGRGILLASRGGDDDGRGGDPLESWMKRLEKERVQLEVGRLAYVATTRARRRLHLVGSVGVTWQDGDGPALAEPRSGSLLRFFWPVLRPYFDAAIRGAQPGDMPGPPTPRERPRRSAPPLRRLPRSPVLPAMLEGVGPVAPQRRPTQAAAVRPQFEWAGEEAMAVGTIVHAELERLARAGQPVSFLRPRQGEWRDVLSRLGLPADFHDGALERISLAVANLRRSRLAAQLLDPEAREAASELALTAWLDGGFVNVRIDRTFVDADGTRWVVDWKTGTHEGGDVPRFLQQEVERYAAQLERYARVVRLFDPRPQRVGLYFPMLDAWQEWTG